jgi:hypothetical protein
MSSLAEVAARAPADIRNMFIYDGTVGENGSQVGVYTVRLYNGSGVAEYVTVDTELPAGGGTYDHPVNNVLWPALAEKAYAEANGDGFVTSGSESSNSYAALNGGWPEWALQAITGQSATAHYAINPSDVSSAWNAGKLVVLCTSSPTSSYIVGDHCYALVNYTPSNGLPFEVYNPWGTDSSGWAPGNSGTKYGLFIANAAFLSQNFTSQSYGVGAAPGGSQGPPEPAGVGIAGVPSAATTVGGGTITRNAADMGTGGGTAIPSPTLTACLVSRERPDATVGALTGDDTIDP